jgi:hypothetical protein
MIWVKGGISRKHSALLMVIIDHPIKRGTSRENIYSSGSSVDATFQGSRIRADPEHAAKTS